MQPPVTHYKDEAPDTETQELLEKELEKEAKAKAEANEPRPELKVLPVKKVEKKVSSSSNIVNAFRQKMAANTNTIELPSIGKNVEFKPISTAEQKDLSKIAMESNSRADIMYCAMLAMINKLCADKDFDIRDYTEFERISVTLNLQQMNKVNPEIKYTCPKCNKENTYKLDTAQLIRKFNKSYAPDQEVKIENAGRTFTFLIGWPAVKNVEDFFKTYYKKYDNASKSTKDTINNLSQVEYVTMFIKKVTLSDSDPDATLTANLEELPYSDRVQLLDCLPQTIVFDENNGIIGVIIESFISPMNKVFKYNDCSFCGAEQDGQMANVTDFIGS